MTTTKIVTLATNAAHNPVDPSFQFRDWTGEFTANERRFVVTTAWGRKLHGDWKTLEAAQYFADSMTNISATASEISPYFYVPGFGRL